jgi:hypothetical protein
MTVTTGSAQQTLTCSSATTQTMTPAPQPLRYGGFCIQINNMSPTSVNLGGGFNLN